MVYKLGPDTVVRKSWPDIVNPEDVLIQENGEYKPLIWSIMDGIAQERGMMFSIARAYHFRDTIHENFRLWQGEWAGQPARLEDDWQWPCLSRVMGWVRFSNDYNRWIRRFRDADIWVPKKNKKSPTLAFLGVYLFAFDGEAGAQVYSVAKDGKQAMRVHDHAIEMVRNCVVASQFSINRSSWTITHKPSASIYAPLHGDNVASQHGINGCYVMDEVHVVPQNLAQVLRSMGASRSEPLFARLSTAGADQIGYGRTRCELGWSIEKGEVENLTTFFKFYGAKQDITDEECCDPKIWKEANPAWGRTINFDEFNGEFQECRRSTIDWVTFKQMRLNIWQTSLNPWLQERDWLPCQRDIDWSEFEGLPCSAGADLSKTSDMTSLAVTWRRDEKVYGWVHFWLPRARVNQLGHEIPFYDWEKLGLLTITEGRVMDERILKREMAEICQRFGVSVFAYDPLFSANIMTHLDALSLGIEMVPFKQSLYHFTAPTVQFDKLVKEEMFHHDGNPILTWQVTHAQLKQRDDYCKPVKPDGYTWKSVDGVQSMLMALANLDKARSVNPEGMGVLVLSGGKVR